MEFVSLDDFLDDVLVEVPGCPIYTARDRIRWAAIEFCKLTGVSVHTTEEIDWDADCSLVELPVPSSNVRAWQVLWISTVNGMLHALNRRQMNERGIIWDGLEAEAPDSYIRKSNTEIQLVPTPTSDTTSAMSIHCSYLPTRDATKLDAVLMDEYREAIVAGALSKLLNMSKEEWYDPAEARERSTWFSFACSEGRALADKDFQTGEQTVRMSPMA